MKQKKYILPLLLILISYGLFSQDHYFKGLADIHYKNYDSAIENFSAAISANPDNIHYYLKRAETYYFAGQYENAVNDLLITEKTAPGSGSYLLAKCYSLSGDQNKAIEWLRKHLGSEYKLPRATVRLDKDLSCLEKTEAWNKLWKKEWYTEQERRISGIRYQIEKEKYDEAYASLEPLLKINPENPLFLYLRSKIFLLQNNTGQAASDLNKAIQYDPGNNDYLFERANILTEQKKYKKALADYNTLLRMNIINPEVYYKRGYVYYMLKDHEKALKDINYYCSFFYKDEKALALCGKLYFSTGNYTEAIKNYTTLLELNPSEIDYYIARGDSYLDSDAYSQAESDYTQALDLNPNIGIIYINRGIARLKTGDNRGACYDWNKANRLGHPDAGYYLSKHCRDKD